MIQYRVFTGTVTEIEAAVNAWAASLARGASINAGPLTRDGDGYFKEFIYQLPERSNGRLAVPQTAIPRGVRRGEPS